MARETELASLAAWYAAQFIGRPYLWRGDDPMAGFDCSGLVVEVLQAVGVVAHGTDYTADGLFRMFARTLYVGEGRPGALAFWLDHMGTATHVEIVQGVAHSIGASGGGSATDSLEDAIRNNAFVKLRPLTYRGRPFVLCDPFAGN